MMAKDLQNELADLRSDEPVNSRMVVCESLKAAL